VAAQKKRGGWGCSHCQRAGTAEGLIQSGSDVERRWTVAFDGRVVRVESDEMEAGIGVVEGDWGPGPLIGVVR
jgi:hypothetical protein